MTEQNDPLLNEMEKRRQMILDNAKAESEQIMKKAEEDAQALTDAMNRLQGIAVIETPARRGPGRPAGSGRGGRRPGAGRPAGSGRGGARPGAGRPRGSGARGPGRPRGSRVNA